MVCSATYRLRLHLLELLFCDGLAGEPRCCCLGPRRLHVRRRRRRCTGGNTMGAGARSAPATPPHRPLLPCRQLHQRCASRLGWPANCPGTTPLLELPRSPPAFACVRGLASGRVRGGARLRNWQEAAGAGSRGGGGVSDSWREGNSHLLPHACSVLQRLG